MDRWTTERAVIGVLTGAAVDAMARAAGLHRQDLVDAVTLYRSAGKAALDAQDAAADWCQVHVEFADWNAAEDVVRVHLWPWILEAQGAGTVTSWWFVRKRPSWRFRLATGHRPGLPALLGAHLDRMVSQRLVQSWRPGVYEAETCAFGGAAGMVAAHRFFTADSAGVLDYLDKLHASTPSAFTMGRRELSVVLCAALMRGASQEWHEQGDIWRRVRAMRPASHALPSHLMSVTVPKVRTLLEFDSRRHVAHAPHDPLVQVRTWLDASTRCGEQIADAVRKGVIHRGVRDVVAHQVVFHWNRLGIPAIQQTILAAAAHQAIVDCDCDCDGDGDGDGENLE